MYDKIYDDCLAKATKNMLPLGYAMFEIKAAAEDWAAEEMEKFAKCNYVGLNLKNVMNGLTETAK